MSHTCWVFIFFMISSFSCFAQNEDLIAKIAPFAYELRIDQGRLAGPGAELLLYEITRADFFLIGEEQGVAEIPGLTQIIYQRAYDMGLRFTHIGIETSDFTAKELERLAVDADADYLLSRYFQEHTGEIPYYEAKEETQMLSDILLTAEDYDHIMWGLGPVSITSVPAVFASLEKLAPDNKAAKLAQKFQKRTEKDNEGAIASGDSTQFGLLQLTDEDLEELVIEFDSIVEAIEISEALKTSRNLYQQYFNHETTAYLASRTQWMFQQFRKFYQQANAVEAKPPRVIIKMNADQLYRGNIPGTNIASLGQKIWGFAQERERTTFHVRVMAGPGSEVLALNEQFSYDTIPAISSTEPAYQSFAALSADGWRVFDLRSIRSEVDTGNLPKQTAKLIEEYDALIILQGSIPATMR